jgi:hypothetical protein
MPVELLRISYLLSNSPSVRCPVPYVTATVFLTTYLQKTPPLYTYTLKMESKYSIERSVFEYKTKMSQPTKLKSETSVEASI